MPSATLKYIGQRKNSRNININTSHRDIQFILIKPRISIARLNEARDKNTVTDTCDITKFRVILYNTDIQDIDYSFFYIGHSSNQLFLTEKYMPGSWIR